MNTKLKTAFILSALSVGTIHIMNRCITAASTMKNLLNTEEGHFFDWRFGKIYYTKKGSGTPLLLIHDLTPCSSSYEWHSVEQKLAKHHTVYTLDLLGCGRSDKPDITYTNYMYVQLISDFIEKVIKQKTDVAATGLSASFVIITCGNHPEILGKILLINPESPIKLSSIPGKRSKIIKFIINMPIIGTMLYHIITNQQNVEYLFTEKYFYNPFLVKAKCVHIYHESAHKGDSNGKYLLSSINGKYVNININSALKNIDNSIYLIFGKAKEENETIAESFTKLNPAVETVFLPECKHLPQLETPDTLVSNMNIFLS